MIAEAEQQVARTRLLHPLAARNFRLLWTGTSLSMLGDQFSFVALAWVALQLTGSPLALGGVLMAAAIPRAAFMLLGGALTDRLSARAVMSGSSAVRAAAMALTAALIFTHTLQLWELYGMSLVFGLADAFFYPARGALVPAVTPPDELEPANALINGGAGLTGLLGAAAAGLVVARYGTAPGFAVDAACFLLVALVVAGIRAQQVAVAVGGIWEQIRGGLRHAWRDPALRAVLLVVAVIDTAFNGPLGVGLASLARARLGGAASLGAMTAAIAAGYLAGNALGGASGRRRRLGPILIFLIAVLGPALVAVGLAPNLAVAVALLFVLGAGGGFANVLFFAWLQRRTAPEMQGRVQSLVMFASVGLAPFAMVASGAVAQVSPSLLFLVAGAAITLTGLAAGFSRAFRAL